MRAIHLALALALSVVAMPALAEDTKQETLKATVVEEPAKPVSEGKPSQPPTAAAETGATDFANTVCTQGTNKRLVELDAGDTAAKKPCEVHYKKETEQPGHDQVLWTSGGNTSYCHAKAKEFVQKLSGWGWTCAKL